MASTYTPAGIELIADGEQSGTWGQTTNTNWELVEELATGVVSISLTGLTTYTLTTTDGTSTEGRHAVVKFTGSPGGTCTVTVSPNDMQKIYWIVNASDQSVVMTQGSGGNVTVLADSKKVMYCDGAGAGAAVVDLSQDLDIHFMDGDKLTFGDSADLEIYHDGSNSIINDAGTGNLKLQLGGSDKLEVTSAGVAVTGTVDVTSVEATNLKAKDGTTSATIADSTGVMTIASSVLTTTDINGGTIDGADITVGAGKTLDVSAGTLTLANDQISGDKVEGGTINATTITTLTSTTVNATTVDSTNLEVTNLKAKDGTAAGSIANSTGVTTLNSAVLTTADINGGTIDGVTIGGSSAAAGTFTTLTATSNVSFDGGTIKLDGNYPVGTGNVALGNAALDALDVGGSYNTALGGGALTANTTGYQNTAVGYQSLRENSTGLNNTAVGLYSGQQNTTGSNNVAVGLSALQSNTTASNNTAVGYQAGYSNTTGRVTAIGYKAANANTTADGTTAVGVDALLANTTGGFNVSVGRASMYTNTTGQQNSVLGDAALYSNTSGSYNAAIGRFALYSNTTANYNTAVGYQSLYANTGSESVAVGYRALFANTTGRNTGIGSYSLVSNTTGTRNTVVGDSALQTNTSGSNNVSVGYLALQANTTASNNTAVGYQAGYSNTAANNAFLSAYSGYSNTTGTQNTYVGRTAGYLGTTGSYNTFVGDNSGYYVTTGSKNTVVGMYNGNQGGLDIRTSSNNIVLSDGDGNPRAYCNSSGDWTVAGGVYLGGTGAANYLDDYEEGTWTPALETGTASSILWPYYTKVGRLVTIHGSVGNVSDTSSHAIFKVTGLPFVAVGESSGACHGERVNTTNAGHLVAVTYDNTSYLFFRNGMGSTNYVEFYHDYITDGADFDMRFSITYITNA